MILIVVSNTSPIANLTVVGQVDLLPQLFGAIVIPEMVYQELIANGEHHPVTNTVMTVDWLDIRPVSEVISPKIYNSFDITSSNTTLIGTVN